MIIKVGGGLEPLGPIGVYAYARRQHQCPIHTARQNKRQNSPVCVVSGVAV